jgi:ribosomal protein S17E
MNSKNLKQIAQKLFDGYFNDFRKPYASQAT